MASGLRKVYKNRKGIDDFFSANFSVSMAYKVGALGSSSGIKDNGFYVEDDVATAVSYCDPCKAILAFSKFFPRDSSFNPYLFEPKEVVRINNPAWSIPEPISLDVMKKRLILRCLRSQVLENLQVYEDCQRIAENAKDSTEESIKRSLFNSTPTLEEINRSVKFFEYPVLSLHYGLESDYSKEFVIKS